MAQPSLSIRLLGDADAEIDLALLWRRKAPRTDSERSTDR
jgi:hypothetical protein